MKSFAFKILFICCIINSTTVQCCKNATSEGSFWDHLIPKYSKLQYAGSMGMFSAGTGWVYGKKRLETDLLIGFAPTQSDRQNLFTATLKQNYTPWKIKIFKNFSLEPLTTGFYINAILNDKNLWATSPDRYSKNYYFHSNRFKFHIFIGQGLAYNPRKTSLPIKSISTFYEVSSFDLYMRNLFMGNGYLKFEDYISLSLGLRFGF
jgi:hypothetical protein